MKMRVLLIGSGDRVRNNFIPAIQCLSDSFEIVAVHSRTPTNLDYVSKRWNISPLYDLQSIDFSSIDLVIISISTSAVPSVLKALMPHASHLKLIIDTPIFGDIKDFKNLGLLKKFKQVLVAEDYMNFPQFDLIRSVISEGVLGNLQHINLFHIGFAYHGMALIRSFIGFKSIILTSRTKAGADISIVNFHFNSGHKGLITEPYLRGNGHISVEGSAGIITNFSFPYSIDKSKKVHYRINEIRNGDLLVGFSITANNYERTLIPKDLDTLRSLDFDDKGEFNLLKTRGLISILSSLNKNNLNSDYTIVQGSYDSIIGRLAKRVPFVIDPFGIIKTILKLM